MIKLINFAAYAGYPELQISEKFSNIENRQFYGLNAEPSIDPRLSFCSSERHIADLNPVKVTAELTTKYVPAICSQPLLGYSLTLLLRQCPFFSLIFDPFEKNHQKISKSCESLMIATLFSVL